MELNDYQNKAITTNVNTTIEHLAFGILEEAGEVAAIFKRIWRHDEGYLNPDDTHGMGELAYDKLYAELGDLLWYIAVMADACDMSLDEVARYNLSKLQRRMAQDRIRGSGDDR
jgi:NTP pyrophosphatase (non-canonical NTP hydrolase)